MGEGWGFGGRGEAKLFFVRCLNACARASPLRRRCNAGLGLLPGREGWCRKWRRACVRERENCARARAREHRHPRWRTTATLVDAPAPTAPPRPPRRPPRPLGDATTTRGGSTAAATSISGGSTAAAALAPPLSLSMPPLSLPPPPLAPLRPSPRPRRDMGAATLVPSRRRVCGPSPTCVSAPSSWPRLLCPPRPLRPRLRLRPRPPRCRARSGWLQHSRPRTVVGRGAP